MSTAEATNMKLEATHTSFKQCEDGQIKNTQFANTQKNQFCNLFCPVKKNNHMLAPTHQSLAQQEEKWLITMATVCASQLQL